MHGYEVDLNEGSTQDFYVNFIGPKETLYETAVYRVHVQLPEQYPFASPSIGFEPHTMFHPNVDERSGSVCLDVINQTWTPLYSLINIFDVFLPQLLTYPNPADPLNADAASLYVKDHKRYEEKVKSYVGISRRKHEQRQKEKLEERQRNEASQPSDICSNPGSLASNPEIDCDDLNGEKILGESEGGDFDCGDFELRGGDSDLDMEFE